MSRCLSTPIRASLLASTLLVLMGPGLRLRAESNTPPATNPPPGTKDIPVQTAGGKTGYVRVQEDPDPYKNVKQHPQQPGKYEPWNMSYGRQSQYASRTFSAPTSAIPKEDRSLEHNYGTKPYGNLNQDTVVPGAKNSTVLKAADTHEAKDFNHNYTTDHDGAKDLAHAAPLPTKAPDEQSRTMPGSDKKVDISPYAQSDKTYLGPGAQTEKDNMKRMNAGLMEMKDLPNRALTIDEVRALVNHGFKPNTDDKPDTDSKPLNDPDYKPQPIRDLPPPADDDEKNSPLPTPGTMGSQQPPENGESLPQR